MSSFALKTKRVAATILVAALLVISMALPVSAKVGETYASRVGGLRIHKGPAGSSEIIAKLTKGERVVHKGTSRGWWLIKTKAGVEGYVFRTYLKPAGNPIRKNAIYKVYKISSLTVRKGPRAIADKVGTIKRGTAVQLKNQRNNWGLIKLQNGNTGWVQLKYLSYLRG